MHAAVLIISSSIAAGPVMERIVQKTVDGCFELQPIESAYVVLRFRIGDDGRPQVIRAEEEDPSRSALDRCLVAAMNNIIFPEATIGTEVAYPVRFRRESEPKAVTDVRRPTGSLWEVISEPRLFGDSWVVASQRGVRLSDIELAHLAGETTLHVDLQSKRSQFLTLAVVEGVTAVLGFGVGAYGHKSILTTQRYRTTTTDRFAGLIGESYRSNDNVAVQDEDLKNLIETGGRRGYRTHDPRLVRPVLFR